jgi:hypothetical protein
MTCNIQVQAVETDALVLLGDKEPPDKVRVHVSDSR